MPFQEPLDDSDRRLLRDIEEHGWHAIVIDDEEPSAYVFSVGVMHTLGHPELVMFGLDHKLMHSVLWGVYRDIRAGRRFEAGGLYEGLIEQYAVAVRDVHESWHGHYLGYAQWHRRYVGKRGSLRAVQIVWPDKAGLFPWEDGCHPSVKSLQPRLDLPMPPPTGGP
jgi:hypothetical protein